MNDASRTYLPAAGHDWSLPLYDPLVKLLGGDRARQALLDQAAMPPSGRVLDVGCGTGTLIAMIRRLYPGLAVVGIDPDPKALARAERKTRGAAGIVQLDRGFSDELPYADASFERVFSSFMFHHLPKSERLQSLREIRRVLKPGGSLHLVDFAPPAADARGRVMRWLHANHHFADNEERRVIDLMKEAGFADASVTRRGTLLLFHMAYYRATAPAV
jgi:ubiquinone/menaquinone biosynthesis C-methylase UbiE